MSTAEIELSPEINIRPAELPPELEAVKAEIEELRQGLPDYEVRVTRRSPYKSGEPHRDEYGNYYRETVRFSDGAVRLMTIGEPSYQRFGVDGVSPIPIIEGDSLFTGPDGFNRDVMRGYMSLGLPFYWIHHQGRHSVRPDSWEHVKTLWHFLSAKGVGRSTHQEHALLDHLQAAGHQTQHVMRGGFSRSSMQGEAFGSQAVDHDRYVDFSDTQATCFAHEASPAELGHLFLKQGPREVRAGARALCRMACQDIRDFDFLRLPRYLGTFDPHPLNVMHELAWLRPLFSGDSGMYAKTIPYDHVGIRTVLSGDIMSHLADQQHIHSQRPEMEVIELHRVNGRVVPKFKDGPRGEDLMHLDGADPEVLQLRLDRLARAMRFAQDHGNDETSLTGLKKKDVLPAGWPLMAA